MKLSDLFQTFNNWGNENVWWLVVIMFVFFFVLIWRQIVANRELKEKDERYRKLIAKMCIDNGIWFPPYGKRGNIKPKLGVEMIKNTRWTPLAFQIRVSPSGKVSFNPHYLQKCHDMLHRVWKNNPDTETLLVVDDAMNKFLKLLKGLNYSPLNEFITKNFKQLPKSKK